MNREHPAALTDRGRDYRPIYRAAFDLHNRHNPPAVDLAYWQAHTPGRDPAPALEESYWEQLIADEQATAQLYDNDPFLMDLITAIHLDLTMQYKAAIQAAAGAQ